MVFEGWQIKKLPPVKFYSQSNFLLTTQTYTVNILSSYDISERSTSSLMGSSCVSILAVQTENINLNPF